MGKLTQAWQADDGQFFETESEMLAYEQKSLAEMLEKNWATLIDSFTVYDGYNESHVDPSLSTTSTESIQQAIRYLQNHLENRPK